jgi:predicted glycosyltransferase involved in capsule biosynthesis
MLKYSIIISYRNREEHLKTNIPRIHEHFTNLGVDFEIIVVEQNDSNPFCRGQLLNQGALVSSGDVLIFHDIDHYPTTEVNYTDFNTDVFLPITKVVYVDRELNPKPIETIPRGYRHFAHGVDDNFYGGVVIFKREKFFEINGFSNVYVGWGLEDADLRERVNYYKLTTSRANDNTFLALDHPDSGVSLDDPHFQNNNKAFGMRFYLLKYGIASQLARVKELNPPMKEIDKWLLATDFAANEEMVS